MKNLCLFIQINIASLKIIPSQPQYICANVFSNLPSMLKSRLQVQLSMRVPIQNDFPEVVFWALGASRSQADTVVVKRTWKTLLQLRHDISRACSEIGRFTIVLNI